MKYKSYLLFLGLLLNQFIYVQNTTSNMKCKMALGGMIIATNVENLVKEEYLGAGVLLKTYQQQKPSTATRVFAGIFSLGVSEALVATMDTSKHYEIYKRDVFLGTDKIEASKKANERGLEYFRNGDYTEALDWFTAADILHSDKNYKNNQNNADAEILNKKGLKELEKRNFNKASDFFDEALRKCSLHYGHKEQFRKNFNIVRSEINNEQGVSEMKRGNYLDSKDLFNEALRRCEGTCQNKSKYMKNRNNADAEISHQSGMNFFNQNDLNSAEKHIQEAVDKTSEQQRKEVFESNLKTIQALKLNFEAKVLYQDGKTNEAKKKIELAIEKYEQAAGKLNEAASKKLLDEVYISFVKVTDALIQVKAYDEANIAIKAIDRNFPGKTNYTQKAKEMISNDKWTENILKDTMDSVKNSSKVIKTNN